MDVLEWVVGVYAVLGGIVAMARCEYDYAWHNPVAEERHGTHKNG